MINRESEKELVQLNEEEGLPITPYLPLAAGRFYRMWEEKTIRNKNVPFNQGNYAPKKSNAIVKRFKEIINKKSSMAQAKY